MIDLLFSVFRHIGNIAAIERRRLWSENYSIVKQLSYMNYVSYNISLYKTNLNKIASTAMCKPFENIAKLTQYNKSNKDTNT